MVFQCKFCHLLFENRQTKYVHQLSCELKKVKHELKMMTKHYELSHQSLNSSNFDRGGATRCCCD